MHMSAGGEGRTLFRAGQGRARGEFYIAFGAVPTVAWALRWRPSTRTYARRCSVVFQRPTRNNCRRCSDGGDGDHDTKTTSHSRWNVLWATTHLPPSPRSSKAFASSSGVGAGAFGRAALCRKGVVSAALRSRKRNGERTWMHKFLFILILHYTCLVCTRYNVCSQNCLYIYSCLQLLLSGICWHHSSFSMTMRSSISSRQHREQ